MTSPAAYDLTPAAHAGVAMAEPQPRERQRSEQRAEQRDRRGRLHALTVMTLFLTFDLVLFGAFTRLTDSGLGCPDWPGCYGSASPLGAHGDIQSAQTALP